MVAIFSGNGLGFQRGSSSVLGSAGLLGDPLFGRGADKVMVNAATGNLLIDRKDEMLIGRGPDALYSQTYNSQGDPNNSWVASIYRTLGNFTGTINTAGSTITRGDGDGSGTVYTYDAAKGAYYSTAGGGSHDELRFANGAWTWTDGNSRTTETYMSLMGVPGYNFLATVTDADGNVQTYNWNSNGTLNRITNADGDFVQFTLSNNLPTQITTYTAGGTATMTRTRYVWDSLRRLTSVTVDLTPGDHSVADGKSYTNSYTYDGTSTRITSISQTDGSKLDMTYVLVGSDYRIATLTQTVAAGSTRTTSFAYDTVNRITTVTDANGQVTSLYYDALKQLTKIIAPPAFSGAPAHSVQFGYNAAGDLISVTDGNNAAATYAYDSAGNLVTETDRLGNVITRTYGARNELLTETKSGSDAASADTALTTRFAYDSENHLRYIVGPEGSVTEYRYDRYGQRISEIQYPKALYQLIGLPSGTAISEATLDAWVSGQPDKSSVKRTNSFYDARGNVTSIVTYSSATRYGEGSDSPQVISPGSNTTVSATSDGYHRITKTSGAAADWDSDAHSTIKTEGDFVLRLRAVQSNKHVVAGLSTAPAANASYTNTEYGLFFTAAGQVYYMESGNYVYLNTNYAAGDIFWITRSGGTISYFKGATLGAAQAAGALRTHNSATQPLYFDSSFHEAGAAIDVTFNPFDINTGVGTQVFPQSDGSYRIVKSGAADSWDSDARSTIKADGDFVLRMKPGQNNKHMVGGVATSPGANASYTNPDYGFYFVADGSVHYMEAGAYSNLGVAHSAGDNFWLVRTGSTISYYKGSTLESAMAAGALRTRTGATGTMWFDSSFHNAGSVMEADFRPATGIANGVNTVVTTTSDGLYRITKTGGTDGYWDADARSSTKTDGDFVLRLRPGQTDKHVIGGVATAPAANAYYTNPDYGLFFVPGGIVYYMEAGNYQPIAGVTFAAGDSFWLIRSGNTINYYKGSTLEAAIAAGAIRTRTGVSGTFHFDSSLHGTGAVMDAAFTPTEGAALSSTTTRVNFAYDQMGQLLSRSQDGQNAETYVYDGLGRLIGSTDLNGGSTSIVFNDAATQTVVTLASGLVRTATYNKAGELVSQTESGSYVAGGTTTHKYDKLGRVRMTTDPTGFNKYFVYDKAGRLIADVLHNGSLTEYRYDANGKLVASVRYNNVLAAATLTTLSDPNSVVEMSSIRPAFHAGDICSWSVYDAEGRLVSTIDGGGGVQTYAYDKSDRLVRTTRYANLLSAAQIAALKTTPPTTAVLPAADAARDAVSRNFYDKEGHLIAVLDGEGYLSRNIYDRAGQKIEQISYINPTNAAYRASGTLNDLIATQPTHADDRRTRYAYDGQGQLRYEVDGLNQVIEYGYDGAGRATVTIHYAGSLPATPQYSYETVKSLIGSAGLAASAANRRSWVIYDASGRVAFAINSDDGVIGYTYTNRGKIAKTVEYAARRSTTSLPTLATMSGWAAGQASNGSNRVTRHFYTARDELRFSVDAEGFVSRTDYDAAGRVTREVRWDTAIAITDGATIDTVNAAATGTWADTRYGYDFGGELTDVWNGENNWVHYAYHGNRKIGSKSVVESVQSWTTYNYDGAGRVVEELEASGTADVARTAFTYDGHGNITSVTDPNNNTSTRAYDRLGRVLSQTDPLGKVTSFQYNAFGETVRTTDARGFSSYTYYDRLGRAIAARDAEDYVTETSYDVFGNALSVTRRYNRANNAASVGAVPTYVAHAKDATTSFQYDKLGRLLKATDAEGHYEQFTLDAFGNRLTMRNKIGGITTNSFDRRGRLLSETLPMASVDAFGATTASSVTNRFQYDARGNLIKKFEAYGLAEQRTTTFVYDKADQLIETRGDTVSALSQSSHAALTSVVPTEQTKYDQRGRVIETIDALGGRVLFYYDKLNRMTAEVRTGGTAGTGTLSTFAYDKNGNVLTSRVYGTAVTVPGTAGGTAPAAPGGEYRETSFTYDKLNRLLTSSVANVRTGAWNGSYFATGIGTVTATNEYDSSGNVIKTTDGAGGVSYFYYDKAGRQVAKVDQENYLTFLTLDAEGNVTQEERLAVKVTAPATTSDPAALRASVAGNAADRITQFGYDRNGRRISETRLNVAASTVGGTGALGSGASHSAIQYSYNGLGLVSQKTYATGDYVSYSYDSTGRLLQESRSPYTDHAGASVRPTSFYHYDGLNNLTMTRQGGLTPGAGDRITRYSYGPGGRLAWTRDATGAQFDYYYDAAGNIVRENWTRSRADGSSVLDGILYNRDLQGRVTSQALATWNGSTWVRGDTQDSGYNAYGDVSQRGTNGLWQEQLAYDGAGRLWRTNSGDGVWRFFVYDGAGNQTLTLESEGANLAGLSLDQALNVATANGAYHVGGAYIDGINATISVFNKRGQSIQTRMPKRQLNATAGAVDLAVTRTYNAFGEVASETDARGFTTDFVYNTMGRLAQKLNPTVNYTTETGAVGSARPTELYYFDAAGRMIGVRDGNGNLMTRSILAGTGHEGSEALVTMEYHADGGVIRNDYDMFGDKRISWDEINRRTDMAYDAMGRMTQLSRPNGLVDYFGYDILGQKITHWNSVNQIPVYGPPQQVWVQDGYWDPYYGWVDTSHWETQTPIVGYTPEKEITDYDLQGRITRQVAFGGDTTTTSYSWNGGIATAGMGTFGGWTESTTYANGRTGVRQTDVFGHEVYKSDLGGHVTTLTYDLAGRVVQRNGSDTLAFEYLNTGLASRIHTSVYTDALNWSSKGTTYGYDASGNLVSERLVDEGHSHSEWWDPYYGWQYSDYAWSNVYKNATATHDSMNRLVSWAEAGSGVMAAASIGYEYDLASNIRRSIAQYRTLDSNGTPSAYVTTQDNWYRFDAMNRVVTKGVLSGGQIVRGNGGVDYLYNQAGERIRATKTTTQWASIYDPWGWDPYYGGNQYMTVPYDADSREDYTYDAAGALATVRIAESGYTDNYDGTLTVTPPPATGALRASYTHDLMGRLTRQIDWLGDGTNAAYDRTVTFNGKGQITNETVVQKQGWDTITTHSYNDFGSGASYALGAITYNSTSSYKNGSYQSTSSTTNSYGWYDGAVQSQISYKPNTSQSTTFTTSFYYDTAGQLTSIYVSDGRPRSVSFVNDGNGQAIKRDESDNKWNLGDPHEIWYRFGGKQLGYTGNNGTVDTDYATSITNRTLSPGTGAYRFGQSYGSAYANFDLSTEAITSYGQGSSAGSHTARAGDSLQSIAAQLWGDSSLWYKLAEANGLGAGNALTEGQRITIPTGVLKSQHNASTLRPYDPGETLGDVSPTTPQPQAPKAAKKNKCGIFGQILLIAISVAVSFILPAVAPAVFGGFWGGIGAAMVGSVVSQGVGLATGIQDKFSWKGVAMAGISAAVGGGLGQALGKTGVAGSKVLTDIVRGAGSSAITQGIGVLTGLQKKFDWAGVAAAGIGAGVAGAVSRGLAGTADPNSAATGFAKVGSFSHNLVVNMASALASAATRSLVSGTSFGDNILAALPGAIGSTIGTAVGGAIVEGIQQIRFDRMIRRIEKLVSVGEGRAADGSPTACFVAGTLVHTPSGTRPIETIRSGDMVFARTEDGNDPTLRQRRVIETYRHEYKSILTIEASTGTERTTTLDTTPEHPVWVDGKGWTQAVALEPGDRLVLVDGSAAVVTDVRDGEALRDVFNFAVDQDHTYFVGDLGVWVHNEYRSALEAAAQQILGQARSFLNTNPASHARAALDRLAQGGLNGTLVQSIERITAAGLRDAGLLVDRPFEIGGSLFGDNAARASFRAVLTAPPVLPNVAGLTTEQQYAVYGSFVLAYGDGAAIRDYRDGNRVMIGFRVETSTLVNNGQGSYDDQLIIMWRGTNAQRQTTYHVESFEYNTEPSAQYDWRAGDTITGRAASAGYEDVVERYKTNARGQRYRFSDGQDANGDDILDLGRLREGNYRYYKSTDAGLGTAVPGTRGLHILRPRGNNPVERDSSGDGLINRTDGNQNIRNLDDDSTMYFHAGGRANTFSAGCQTIRPADWTRFWNSLGSSTDFSYVLLRARR